MESNRSSLSIQRRLPVKRKVNLNYPPIVDNRWTVESEAADLTIGDFHACGPKFLYFCKYHKIFIISDINYKKFINIYNKPFYEDEDIKNIKEIISQMEVNPKASISILRFLGDELVDRGKNDYFILLLLEKLALHNINFHILISNHNIFFIRNMEIGSTFQSFELPEEISRSLHNLQELIESELVTREEINRIYNNVYLPHLKFIDYSIGEDNRITIYTHAPAGRKVIRKLVKEINEFNADQGITIKYLDKNAQELANTIDQINKILLDMTKSNKLHIFYSQGKNKALHTLIWNRDYDVYLLERHDKDRYVHGHDLGWQNPDLPDGEKILFPTEDVSNVCSLDNRCGHQDIYSYYENYEYDNSDDYYSILYTNKHKNHLLRNFYVEPIPQLQNIVLGILKVAKIDTNSMPLDKEYEFYDVFYNILLIMSKFNLITRININWILFEASISVTNLNLIYDLLVEGMQISPLTQTIFDGIKNNNNKLDLVRNWKLFNHICIINPSLDSKEIKSKLNYQAVNELLILCDDKNILNYNIYIFITNNLDKANVMIEKINISIEEFTQFVSKHNAIKKYMDLMLKHRSSDEETKQAYYSYLDENFDEYDLVLLHSYLALANEAEVNNKMTIQQTSLITKNDNYLKIIVNLCDYLDINFKNEFEDIFCHDNYLHVLDWFDIFRCQIDDKNLVIKYLSVAYLLNAKNLLSEELIIYLDNEENENIASEVADLIRYWDKSDALNQANLDILIKCVPFNLAKILGSIDPHSKNTVDIAMDERRTSDSALMSISGSMSSSVASLSLESPDLTPKVLKKSPVSSPVFFSTINSMAAVENDENKKLKNNSKQFK